VISDDGKTLYLNRRFHPENVRGEKDFQDVWVSRLDPKGFWSKPFNLKEPYNDKKANDLVRASTGGDSLIFVNDGYKGVSSELALFLKNDKNAIDVPIDGYYNNSPYVDFDFLFKEKVIIMAVERKDSNGDQDLYYSIFQPEDNRYSTPMNMGNVINSEMADFAPFLTVDGNTIFFASYGHKGNGAADIFMSHRLGDGWDKWSKPENLGKVVNSPFEETFVSIDPSLEYLYYDSYPPNATNRSIWRATLSDDIKNKIRAAKANNRPTAQSISDGNNQLETTETTPAITETKEEIALDVPTETLPSVAEKVEVSASETTQALTTENERLAELEEEENKPKISETGEKIDTPEEQVKSSEKNFFSKLGEKLGLGSRNEPFNYIDSGNKGLKISRNVYFNFNSDKIQFKQNSLIQMVYTELETKPNSKLLIEGHTDGIGGEDINNDLSCRRAKNVKDAVVSMGVNPLRIEISCEGKERPLATNDDEFEGRELNRRVEFYLF
jgi:outer membrane protein OmpA-like peptidoglycan-associated protein